MAPIFPDKIAHGPRIKAGGEGEYFEEHFWQGRSTRVCVSTCHHCGHQTEFPSQKRMMDYVDICYGCMKLICLGCVGKPCRPQEAECEAIEREVKRKLERDSWGCY